MELNNWNLTPVIHKNKIINYEYLIEEGYIIEIQDDYYCLKISFDEIEDQFYTRKVKELKQKLQIKDIENELKTFIKKLNKYNEFKDVAQALIGKIAELRGETIKDVYNSLGLEYEI